MSVQLTPTRSGPLEATSDPRWAAVLLVALAAAAAALSVSVDDATPLLGVWLVPVVWAAAVDARTSRLPDRIVLPGIAIVVAAVTAVAWIGGDWSLVRSALVGALVLGVPFAVMHVLSPSGFGYGDVKFGVLLGLGLGLVRPGIGLVVFLTAALLQLVIAAVRPWPAQRQPDATRAAAPFGPVLAIAAVGWLVVVLVSGGGV
jgi:leader peptidase (prepilin peptidase) / N-methyltransferase